MTKPSKLTDAPRSLDRDALASATGGNQRLNEFLSQLVTGGGLIPPPPGPPSRQPGGASGGSGKLG